MFTFFESYVHMRIEGAWGMTSCGREELGLTLVRDEVPGSSLVGGDRWYIMSLAMRVGGLEVV
jgi:hypothetical protein